MKESQKYFKEKLTAVLPFKRRCEPLEIPDEAPDRDRYTSHCGNCNAMRMFKSGKCETCKK
jgi:hypothetical protein